MVEVLRNFFRSVMALSPDDMVLAVYLCLNKLAPDYQGVELGVGESLLVKALAEATGRTPDKIKAEVAVKGDLGLVAEVSISLLTLRCMSITMGIVRLKVPPKRGTACTVGGVVTCYVFGEL